MDAGAAIERECGALGGLFQTIINDMRGSSPVWEDFTCKASKLHSSLRTSLLAISAFLDAFQKVADLATGSRGATKEVGSALTRLCMRHRSIESKLKTLTSSVMDGMVMPLQEKLEDWKKVVVQLDKDHAKEYKKAKHEIKKAASDTVRLQKKMKKDGVNIFTGKNDMQSKLDHAMHDVNDKYKLLEEAEKNALRTALIEERGRFCLFISCIKPFVDNEVALLSEITHLQEIMHSLCQQASDPHSLPESSEQVITDIKGIDAATFNLQGKNHQHSPPSSPSSLGSRKSSMCSISSINSSSSGSLKSHSPSHSLRARNVSQHMAMGTIRLTSVSSQDSGFTSQDTLFLRPNTPQSLNLFQSNVAPDKNNTDNDGGDTPENETPTTPNASTPSANSTWNNWPNQPSQTTAKIDPNRPHTISSAYEKSHNRPALNKELFEPLPEATVELRHDPKKGPARQNSVPASPYARPNSATINKMQPVLPPLGPKPRPKAVSCPKVPSGPQPIYANTVDLAKLVAERREELEMMESPESDRGPTPPTPSNASMQQNSMELAQAIKELEESTAALESTYEPSPTGLPMTNSRTNSLKRNGNSGAPKPPPPVRRSSSVSTGTGAVAKVRASPPRQMGPPITAPKPPSKAPPSKQNNGKPSPQDGPYAELQLIQNSIKHQQQQKQHHQQNRGPPVSPSSVKVMPISPDRSSTGSASSTVSSNSHYAISAVQGQNGNDNQYMQGMRNQFAAMNMQHNVQGSNEMDLPLPPTDDELKEIEKIYSRPPPQLPAASDLAFVKELKRRVISEDGSDV